ncbi:low affinity immunoglobulin epsilon Fc receptor-like [Pomacea canaliculata]|uniref:low affinity immunoglobulin epsilon Fc receptor-like n=1 Tax=Pomacea canaliculata TaxID=400727 RepID=UPI000D72F558|nr:low affinity immunoglobulin epsilon Fc receptor-like [Pomacea canaliculata]
MSSASVLLLVTLLGLSSCLACRQSSLGRRPCRPGRWRCPAPWVRFRLSCYTYIEHPLPWIDAASLCKLLGANLVEINSAAENMFVNNIYKSRNVEHGWLGINDIQQNGRWVLTSTGRPLPYSNWAPGEPNNYAGKQGCALMYRNGKWDDNSCLISTAFTFVCERRRVFQ